MNRFFLPPDCIQGTRILFPAESAAQIRRVLRLEHGDSVVVLDNAGSQFEVRLEKVDASGVEGSVTSKGNVQGESKTRVCLFCALTQRDKLEWIIQKATEAGVAEIIFFGARRALVRAGNITTAKLERWRAIAREAAEQCARGSIPQVRVLKSLQEGLHNAENCTLKLAGWEAEQEQNLSALMSEINQSYQLDKPLDLAVFIGPEGGFDVDEVEKMRSAGIRLFSIGRRVLRMETAAMLIPALILYERGGFNL